MVCFQKVKNPVCVNLKSAWDQYLGVFCPILPVSKRKKNCVYAVSQKAWPFLPHWSLPLDKDNNGLIFHPTPLKHLLSAPTFVRDSELSSVYAQHGCCHSQHLISAGVCSASHSEQVYELTQSEAPVHRCIGSCQWQCSCKLPLSPLESHVLVGCLPSFMPCWTLTVSPVRAELLWSSQSSTAGNDLAESPRSLPHGVLLAFNLLALLSP